MEPSWADRMARDRGARGWSQRQAVEQMRRHCDVALPDDESLLRNWKRWERGTRPSEEYQVAIARMFSSVQRAYFDERPAVSVPRLSNDQTVELVQQLRSSAIDDPAVDALRITVDQLCTDYSTRDTRSLLDESRQWLSQIGKVLQSGLSYRHHGEMLRLAGWLTLLASCLHWDAGNERAARAARTSALTLGRDLTDPEILGWGAEIGAWMALTHGDWQAVLAAAELGLAETRQHSVSVQLHAQQAKAWSRMGNRAKAESSLGACRELMSRLPDPDNPRNHFTVDPIKVDFYAMDCYRRLGADELAHAAAETIRRASIDPTGARVSPMRLAEADLTDATIRARSGDLTGAMNVADEALNGERKSLPSLLLVGNELADELRRLDPTGAHSGDFIAHLRDLRSG